MHKMTFRDVELEFEYESSPYEAQTHWEPAVEAEFNILEVYAGGVEITELLDWNDDLFCEEINKCAIEALKEEGRESYIEDCDWN